MKNKGWLGKLCWITCAGCWCDQLSSFLLYPCVLFCPNMGLSSGTASVHLYFICLVDRSPAYLSLWGFFWLFLPVCSHVLACKKEQAYYFHYPYKAGKVSIADQFLLQLSKSSAPLLSGEYPLNDTEYWSENYIYTRPKPYKGSRKEQSVSWVIRCDWFYFSNVHWTCFET